jgi:endonuclease YncB( thermonuclease family)
MTNIVDAWWPPEADVVIERVVDGDTVVALIPMQTGTSLRWKVRLEGIDTPELHRGSGEERERGKMCKALLEEMLLLHEGGVINMTISGCDNFGRLLGTLYRVDGRGTLDVNKFMLEHGEGTVVYRR